MSIPQRTDVPADGGAVVRNTPLELISPSVLHEVGAINLARQSGGVVRSGLQSFEYPKITGELDAAVVSEGSNYGTSSVGFDSETITLQKIGLVLGYTDEFLRANKSVTGVEGEIAARVDRAFGKAWDKNLLGLENGSSSASAFAFDFDSGVSDTINLEDSGDGVRKSVSQAIGEIYEATGLQANGVLLPSDAPQLLRDARVTSTETGGVTTTNAPLYQDSSDPLYGLGRAVSHNLARVGDATPDSTVMVVGDFSQLRVLIHADVESEVSRVASVDGDSGFEQDKIWVKYRSYGTCFAANPDAFRKIIIPAGS